MSNSQLVTYVDISSNNWDYRSSYISRITIHIAPRVCTMKDFSSIIRSTDNGSWNYAIDKDGSIGLFVDESHRAWGTGDSDNDNKAVTIQVSPSSASSNYPVSNKVMTSLKYLCEDICRRNQIDKLTYTGKLEGSNVTLHKWFRSVSCPGSYLQGKIPEIVSTVNSKLKKPSTIPYPEITNDVTALTASLSKSSGSKPEDIISVESLTPYVITTDRSTGELNYASLKKIGVCGVVLESGYLYNDVHLSVGDAKYRNPNLKRQAVEAAKAGVPYGLWHRVSARTIDEAKKEIKCLKATVQLYTPILGVWLRLNLSNSKSQNSVILSTYYEALKDMGLGNSCGLYCTKSQLERVDWKNQQDNYLLWIDDHLPTTLNMNNLLTPAFFDINIE